MANPVSQQVEEKILKDIKEQSLGAGDRLAPERVLADRFKVSRNTVREAILSLREKGILVSRRGAGSFVTGDAAQMLKGQLHKMAEQKRLRLAEVFEVRGLLEPAIAARAARTITPDKIDHLQSLVDRQADALARGGDPVVFDEAFHEALVRATGNSVLRSVYDTFKEILKESRSLELQTPERTASSVKAHQHIIRALRNKDPDAAFREMAHHMAAVEKDSGF